MRRSLTTLAAGVAAAAAAVALAAPVYADTTTFTDPRGDAPARYDLTRTAITNNTDQIVITQTVRALRGGTTQIYAVNMTARGEHYILHTIRTRNGTIKYRFDAPTAPDGSSIDCNIHATWRLTADRIRVTLPRDCVTAPGPLRVSTAIGAGNGTSGDPADWTETVRVGQD